LRPDLGWHTAPRRRLFLASIADGSFSTGRVLRIRRGAKLLVLLDSREVTSTSAVYRDLAILSAIAF
jgi:hypothetical protein